MAVRSKAGRPRDARGLTLIEVMIAASLLLLTVVCATPLLVGSRWTASREGHAGEAGRLAASRLERLSSLAFGPSSSATGGEAAGATNCVVTALFPHAHAALNGVDDFFVLAGGEPWAVGSFVTRRREGPFAITTESRFGVATAAGFAPVAASRLAGYASATGGALPSGALLVTVQVSWTERGVERSVKRRTVLSEGS